MTADYVAFHASERPDAVAVVHDGRAISFAELNRSIGKVTGALCAVGLVRGNSVAVGTNRLYLHWLLSLACERLGIAAASLQPADAQTAGALLASVDLVLADPDCPTPRARRVLALTQPWIEAALSGLDHDGEPLPAKSPDDPVRIVLTSGTTGVSKRFLVTRRMHEALSMQWQWGFALGRGSRYLQTLPLAIRATYDLGCASLRAGGALVLETRMSPIAAIAAHAVTHAILLPIVLQSELDRLPADFAKLRALTIVSFGAPVSDSLRKRAIERLATELCDLYGTVEVSIVSAIWRSNSEGFGTLWPQVQAEAVDDRGQPVPPGEPGRLRVKAPYMSDCYMDDPETTARLFRSGWFYPGDVAMIRPGGQLKILGRVDDLLNLGGQKFLPAVLEESLARREVAGDVGVCSLRNAEGIEVLCIAVTQVSHDDRELMRRIDNALRSLTVGRFHVVKLARIPRAANGKLQRKLLKEEAAHALGAR
ncbi:MAG TPA: class I adenylate-forming enzyme family protein [Stellaceae bacterium]|nr:class I adenylate-forming enzyme family protein [Stellaceae bacterium]